MFQSTRKINVSGLVNSALSSSMGNYDCRGASIGIESWKSKFLSFIGCHLWGEWKRLLYLLLKEKRPLLHYRKSLNFWQPPNQSISSFKPSSGTYAGFVILFRIKPISEGTLSHTFRNAHFISTFPFAIMLLCRGKEGRHSEHGKVLRAT